MGGGGKTGRGGGHEVLPYEKGGGAEIVLAMLKGGGHDRFCSSFNTGA